jgi:hypothetical protein
MKTRLSFVSFVLVMLFGAGCGARTDLAGGGATADAGAPADAAEPPSCTGLCMQQVACPEGLATTLTGTAYTPSGMDPVYNAVVYVPSAPLAPFSPGVSCEPCGAPVSGSPLVETRTGPDGRFTLVDVPVGKDIPLVIQIGRWRRQVTIADVAACQSNSADASLTRLPRNQSEGDIPLMAVVTGSADALECTLRKMGVDDAEFSPSAGTGRVQIYVDNGAAVPLGLDPSELMPGLSSYDDVILDCDGIRPGGPSSDEQPLVDYTGMGGRVLTTHFGYDLLENAPFSGTLNLANPPDEGSFPGASGFVETASPGGQAFLQWLQTVNALTAPDAITLGEPQRDIDSVVAPSQAWISTHATDAVGATTQLYTFETPVGVAPAEQCGQFVFSSFHVSGVAVPTDPSVSFPDECDDRSVPMTATEKAFEFMLFNLRTCLRPTASSADQ